MRKILILGGTGSLGKVLINHLLNNNYEITALVRNPDKIDIRSKRLNIIKGNVNNMRDLNQALKGANLVITVLGHGFRTKYPILKVSLNNLIPLMEQEKIKRIITVSGAALKTDKDPNSLILFFTDKMFNLIDPYRLGDAKNQYKILKESSLDWTIIRTPIHKNGEIKEIKNEGYMQPLPWYRITRKTIAQFVINCIEEKKYIKEAPIIF